MRFKICGIFLLVRILQLPFRIPTLIRGPSESWNTSIKHHHGGGRCVMKLYAISVWSKVILTGYMRSRGPKCS
jgi:hypothetical protein